MTEPQVTTTFSQPAKPARRPQKITQLLCLDQNSELKSIFITWLSQSFKYLPDILSKIYLQLELLINFIQYRFTVSEDHSQVGDYLQNIKYKNLAKNVKLLYLLLDVILPYVKRRFVMFAQGIIEKDEKERQEIIGENAEIQVKETMKSKIIGVLKKIVALIGFLDKLYPLGSFINLAVFIKNGKYRTLIQRVLKMQMQFVNPQNSRVLNFTLMNRTMIWQIYEMVLKNILPYLYKFLGTGLKNIFYLHSYMGVQQKQDEENCAVCGQVPTMAVKSQDCGHIYCFYCSKSLDQEKRQCKKCGTAIEKWVTLYG